MNKNKLFIGLFVLLTSFSAFALRKVPTLTGNYCKDEIIVFMDDYFDGKAAISEITFARTYFMNEERRSWRAWVKTNLCDGYFVFMPFLHQNANDSCTKTHYGSSYPHYVNSVYGTRDCKNFLHKRSVFLKKRPTDF